LEEQVRGFGFERYVADLVDDEQRVAGQAAQLVLQPAGAVVLGEPVTGRLPALLFGIAVLLTGLGGALFAFIAALVGRRRAAQPPSR